MKNGYEEIIGKTISGVVMTEDDNRYQIYLTFKDGTFFEFWGNGTFSSSSCVMPGGKKEVISDLQKRRIVGQA